MGLPHKNWINCSGKIPGLYSAEIDLNVLYGDIYIFDLALNTIGFVVNNGCMAAGNAAK